MALIVSSYCIIVSSCCLVVFLSHVFAFLSHRIVFLPRCVVFLSHLMVLLSKKLVVLLSSLVVLLSHLIVLRPIPLSRHNVLLSHLVAFTVPCCGVCIAVMGTLCRILTTCSGVSPGTFCSRQILPGLSNSSTLGISRCWGRKYDTFLAPTNPTR